MSTPTRAFSQTTLKEVCEYADIDEEGITGTYPVRGGTCFGVIMPRGKLELFLLLLGAVTTESALLRDAAFPTDEAIELGGSACTATVTPETMIVYFPGWSMT